MMGATVFLHEPSVVPLSFLGQKARLSSSLRDTVVFCRMTRPAERFQIYKGAVWGFPFPSSSPRTVYMVDVKVFGRCAYTALISVTFKCLLAIAAMQVVVFHATSSSSAFRFWSFKKRAVSLFCVQFQATWFTMICWSSPINYRIAATGTRIFVSYNRCVALAALAAIVLLAHMELGFGLTIGTPQLVVLSLAVAALAHGALGRAILFSHVPNLVRGRK